MAIRCRGSFRTPMLIRNGRPNFTGECRHCRQVFALANAGGCLVLADHTRWRGKPGRRIDRRQLALPF